MGKIDEWREYEWTQRYNSQNLGNFRRLALGLMRKVKGKQTVPTMMFKAALSTEFRTAIIEKIINEKFWYVSPGLVSGATETDN